jgi:hypothetical protein
MWEPDFSGDAYDDERCDLAKTPRRQARQGKKRQKDFLGVLGALGENT